MNKTMWVKELIMQYKLYELTLSSTNQKSSLAMTEEFLTGYDKGQNKDSVNPFLPEMFQRISFAAWVKILKKTKKENRKKMIL